jgi:FkbM family methyltransferase
VSLKSVLQSVRGSQPLNWCATTAAHAVGHIVGRQSELLVRYLPRTGRVARRLPNGRTLQFWSRGDDLIANQVFWRGWNGYEPETARPFFDLAARAQVTVDVGAHVGYFSLLAGHANARGRVFAFEPHPAAFDRLRCNVRLNGLANVECIRIALGAADAEADLHFADTAFIPVISSLSYELMRATPALGHARVTVRSLDAFVAERALEALDLIKLDTETTEPDILRGCRASLERFRPTVVCEVLRGLARTTELRALLRVLEYRAHLLTPAGRVADDALGGHERWRNYLFVPAERRPV